MFKRSGTVELISDDSCQELGRAVGDTYQLVTPGALVAEAPNINEYVLWHHRLGHPSRKTLLELPKHVIGLEKARLTPPGNVYEGCIYGKSHCLPFDAASNRTEEILGRVHTDLCGPILTPSVGGARYILTFIDDATRYTKAYFLKPK